MENFTVRNTAPLNLNFILYIYNLYKNCDEYSQDRFPFIKVNEYSLLDRESVFKELGILWNKIIDTKGMIDSDFEIWINEKIDFKSFFKGEYKFIRKTFESWYFGTGINNGGCYSEKLVEEYYREITGIFKDNNKELPNISFKICEVYSDIPKEFKRLGKDLVIVSNMMEDIEINKIIDEII